MKKNYAASNCAARALRIESLENRAMLSATPFDGAAEVVSDVNEIAATEVVDDAPIVVTLVDSESSDASEENVCVATYSVETRVATFSWAEMDGAQTYKLRISRDGGETWYQYAKDLEGTETNVNGLYPTRSYDFILSGYDSDGVKLEEEYAFTFAPVGIKTDVDAYTVGQPITATLRVAENGAADIHWYAIVDGEDVEIEEARGSLEYAPENNLYDLKVVAVGTGDSQGAYAEATVAKPSPVSFEYDAQTRVVTLGWDALGDATNYKIQLSRNDGETWLKYVENQGDCSFDINGLYPGYSYIFRVYGFTDDGARVPGNYEATFAPVGIKTDAVSYVSGDTISATIVGAENATGDVSWYLVTGSEDVEIVEARGSLSYTPDDDLYDLKVVVVGTGDSEGSFAEKTIKSNGDVTRFDYVAETRVAQLSWRPVDDAVVYKIQISRNGGQNWYQYAKNITTTTHQINGLYIGKSYQFHVIGFSEDGTKLDDIYDVDFAPVAESTDSVVDEAFASLFADELYD